MARSTESFSSYSFVIHSIAKSSLKLSFSDSSLNTLPLIPIYDPFPFSLRPVLIGLEYQLLAALISNVTDFDLDLRVSRISTLCSHPDLFFLIALKSWYLPK